MSPEDLSDSTADPASSSSEAGSPTPPASAADVTLQHPEAVEGPATISPSAIENAATTKTKTAGTTAKPTSTSGSSSTASKKRSSPSASAADGAPPKVAKRRAARACVSCRARKVRCDVVEGAPCGNCRWDNVECVVQESRRRRKNLLAAGAAAVAAQNGTSKTNGVNGSSNGNSNGHGHVAISSSADLRRPSDGSIMSLTSLDGGAAAAGVGGLMEGHVPHMIYQRSGYRNDPVLLAAAKLQADASQQRRMLSGLLAHQQASSPAAASAAYLGANGGGADATRTAQFLSSLEEQHQQHQQQQQPDDLLAAAQLPAFIRPLPARIAPEDVRYLRAKGALTLPTLPLQQALLRAYAEYVHPYMPLMELHEFLAVVDSHDGLRGQVSLFLYQAVMFSATAFVDTAALREAGYATRKAARKAFFHKTRLLYDFDYESDRLVLVQALLLMTYWYETPDDQKDTWHWMGVAISLAHTIGLHRNPAVTAMPPRKQKLWKRIWWSCFMRDRLVALGMRRPTRIKDEDFDVPMLEESDFEIESLPAENQAVPADCTLMRDLSMQRELAVLCIAKAKLCICISHMLRTQYSVLIRDKVKPDDTVNSTMMLFPNKKLDNMESVNSVDLELLNWADSLPPCCQYRPLTPLDVLDGRATLAVQRTLLHMVYYTTVSALHRPQFLPSSPATAPTTSRQVQEISRLRVRDAAAHTTRMAAELHALRLERFLPTTGVTVILPAMIIHLLEMKNPAPHARERATKGFRQCMRVLEKLREIYAAADYATGFLEAALRKAAIDMNAAASTLSPATLASLHHHANVKPSALQHHFSAQTPPPENAPYMTATESLFASASASMAAAHQHQHQHQQHLHLMAPLGTTTAAALELSPLGAASPPQTERDLESALTPSASGGSSSDDMGVDEHHHHHFHHLHNDKVVGPLEFLGGEGAAAGVEFDWGAVAGADFDVDQWLQFPAEGPGSNGEDVFMTGIFSGGEEGTPTGGAGGETVSGVVTATPEQALSWAMSLEAAGEMDGLEGATEVAVEA